ncbi:MAG TPA: helix-turn-helix transcriptional regulator [Actinomycetota bacterium]|nr:helix-turn-helix transcriptional regulator [Actinomycetota bacterium]
MTLRELRKARDLTLEAAAFRCSLGSSTISKIERGLVVPSTRTVAKLARGLDTSIARMRQILEETSRAAA